MLFLSAIAAVPSAGFPQAEPQEEPRGARAREAVVACTSKPGGREFCPANTSKGIALARSFGDSPCLLGKTWGYDDSGVWVADGCSGWSAGGGRSEKAVSPRLVLVCIPGQIPLCAAAVCH